MDLTQENVESVAAKLEPLVTDLSAAERDLLNQIFTAALDGGGPDVEGFALNVGGSSGGGTTPPVKQPAPATSSTASGSTSTDTNTAVTVKSSPINPVTIKFF